MFESQLMQMPGPKDIVNYWPGPQAFSVVQKPLGLGTHFGAKTPGCRGEGMVTGQIDTCFNNTRQRDFVKVKAKIINFY